MEEVFLESAILWFLCKDKKQGKFREIFFKFDWKVSLPLKANRNICNVEMDKWNVDFIWKTLTESPIPWCFPGDLWLLCAGQSRLSLHLLKQATHGEIVRSDYHAVKCVWVEEKSALGNLCGKNPLIADVLFGCSLWVDITYNVLPNLISRRIWDSHRGGYEDNIFCLPTAITLVSSSAYSSTLKMEAIWSSETSVDFQRTTENSNL
jgi:hypothetical protein